MGDTAGFFTLKARFIPFGKIEGALMLTWLAQIICPLEKPC